MWRGKLGRRGARGGVARRAMSAARTPPMRGNETAAGGILITCRRRSERMQRNVSLERLQLICDQPC